MTRQFDIANVNPEWMDVIREFPKIFLEPSKEVLECYEKYGTNPENLGMCNIKENLVNLRFGIEHGLGWKEIVRGFCRDMQELANKAESNGDKFQYKGCIMKEKFGAFTPQGDIDHSGCWEKYRDEYYNIIDKWEDESVKTCEITGKPGKLRDIHRGWVKTLCEEEYEKVKN